MAVKTNSGMNSASLLKQMKGIPVPPPVLLVEDQTVPDIIKGMLAKHNQCKRFYDEIFEEFEGGDIWEVSERLWNFCVDNLDYKIESLKDQRVSNPVTMLKRSYADCKGYALFISGCLDAMRRAGDYKFNWVYRYASYNLLKTEKGHVFVVVNPETDNIWIDPVLDNFNEHAWYWYKEDRVPEQAAKKVAGLSGLKVMHYGGQASGAGHTAKISHLTSGIKQAPRGAVGATAIAYPPSAVNSSNNGGSYGALVFNNQNLTPGAGAAFQADPPFAYFIGANQLILPPANMTVGATVPEIPAGLEVEYAQSFWAVAIPASMPVPFVWVDPTGQVPNKLRLAGITSATQPSVNAYLLANNKVLLNVLIAVMGALVNSYSSHPYSNPYISGKYNAAAFGTLSGYILTDPNRDDFLVPDPESKTLFQEILPTLENIVLPAAAAVVSVVATPAAGAAVLAADQALAKNVSSSNATPVNTVDTSAASAVTNAPATAANNPFITATGGVNWLVVGGVLAGLGLLYYLSD